MKSAKVESPDSPENWLRVLNGLLNNTSNLGPEEIEFFRDEILVFPLGIGLTLFLFNWLRIKRANLNGLSQKEGNY